MSHMASNNGRICGNNLKRIFPAPILSHATLPLAPSAAHSNPLSRPGSFVQMDTLSAVRSHQR